MNLSKVYQNLKEDNYKLQFLLKDRFYVFKIENFLDQESYNFIEKNFYNFSKDV